jgi:hypothetical protein
MTAESGFRSRCLLLAVLTLIVSCGQTKEQAPSRSSDDDGAHNNKSEEFKNALSHGFVHENEVSKAKQSSVFNFVDATYRDKCASAGIALPIRIPNFNSCIRDNSFCNGWIKVGRALPPGTQNFAVSADLNAQLFKLSSGTTTCLYLHRYSNNPAADTLNGVHCYNTTNCSVCALDIIKKGAPTSMDDLVDPSQFKVANNGDCSACHASGPLAVKKSFFDQTSGDLQALNTLCASKGGPNWIQTTNYYQFSRPTTARKVKAYAGCDGCHTGGFVKTNSEFCGMAKAACSDKGSMFHEDAGDRNGGPKFDAIRSGGRCLTSREASREFAKEMGCALDTFEGCADRNVKKYRLNVTPVGSGTVTGPGSISCGTACSPEVDECSTVTLNASPGSGSTFSGWSGACSGTGPCSVVMTKDIAVTATFASGVQGLSVSKTGTGTGTVISSPSGISCGATCSANFRTNTIVTLTASPATGSTFAGWSGACSGSATTCQVTMNAVKSVTASFNASSSPAQTLSVSKTGTGTGTVTSSPSAINCGATCSANFSTNTIVTLTASPATGSTFAGWSGACSGSASTCRVTMNAAWAVIGAGAVTATFNATSSSLQTLSVSKTGTGTGTVISSPSGINCGATCSANFSTNTIVTLTASPATGSTFAGWGGACSGSATTCQVAMNAARSVTTTFKSTSSTPQTIELIVDSRNNFGASTLVPSNFNINTWKRSTQGSWTGGDSTFPQPQIIGLAGCQSGRDSVTCPAQGGESYGVITSCGSGCMSGTVTVSRYGIECNNPISRVFNVLGNQVISNATMGQDPCPGTPKSAQVALTCNTSCSNAASNPCTNINPTCSVSAGRLTCKVVDRIYSNNNGSCTVRFTP